MTKRKITSPIMLATTALFTALVCMVTMSFSVYVPATRGFFNIGDSMVFVTALLFGSLGGAFAGGVGSALADLLLGYWYYAPGTLPIKGLEGYIVGWLFERKPAFSQSSWRILTIVLGFVLAGLLTFFGIGYYSGDVDITIGSTILTVNIPWVFWAGLAVLMGAAVAGLGWRNDPEIGWMILTVTIGGFAMVTGYFAYQYFLIGPLFNIEVIAVAEIPINLGQMVVGIALSIPLVRSIKRYIPSL